MINALSFFAMTDTLPAYTTPDTSFTYPGDPLYDDAGNVVVDTGQSVTVGADSPQYNRTLEEALGTKIADLKDRWVSDDPVPTCETCNDLGLTYMWCDQYPE